MIIEVSKEDIEESIRLWQQYRLSHNPVELAIRRTIKAGFVAVTAGTVRIYWPKKSYEKASPQEVADFIDLWDAKAVACEPFSFPLPLEELVGGGA